jgi:hypothetical protein
MKTASKKVDPGEAIGAAGAAEVLARMRKRMQECLQSSPDDLDDPDDPADHDFDGVPLRFWLH